MGFMCEAGRLRRVGDAEAGGHGLNGYREIIMSRSGAWLPSTLREGFSHYCGCIADDRVRDQSPPRVSTKV